MQSTRLAEEIYLNSTVRNAVKNRKTFKADSSINDVTTLINETVDRLDRHFNLTTDFKKEVINYVLGLYAEDFENWFTNQKREIYKYTDQKLQQYELGIAPSFI